MGGFLVSQRHHTHITDIAENEVNVIMMMVESLSDESLTSRNVGVQKIAS